MYTHKDPKYPGAKKFTALSWQSMASSFLKNGSRGFMRRSILSAPHSPRSEELKAIVMDGRDLKNFGALLKGKEFQGTVIGEDEGSV